VESPVWSPPRSGSVDDVVVGDPVVAIGSRWAWPGTSPAASSAPSTGRSGWPGRAATPTR
jgi:hypothetical protein